MKTTIIFFNPSIDERWEITVSTNQWASWKSNNSEGSAVDLQTHYLEAMEIEAVEQFKLWIGEEEFNQLEREN